MNKRGTFGTLMDWIIVLLVFFLIVYFFFLSPSGLQAATKIGEKLGLSNLPVKPQEKIKESEKVSNDVKDSFYDLIDAIKYGKDIKKNNCLIKYNAFPDSISDFNINVKESEDALSLTVYNKLGQVELSESINGLKSCYYKIKNGPNFNDIIINKKDKVNANEELDYSDVIILEANYKLLYKDNSNNICFITQCDTKCLQTLLLENNIDFCDISYKEVYTDVFYDNTYYGNLKDWNLVSSKFYGGKAWKYIGTDGNVAYEFVNFGISREKLQGIFLNSIKQEVDGIWYSGYYGKKEDWCYKKIKGILWDSEEWIYNGKENTEEKKINKDKKNRVFGPVEIKEC